MNFSLSAVAAGIAGKLGELQAPKDTASPEFRRRQAIREYNALLERTDPTAPAGAPSMKCITSDKAVRRQKRRDLIRVAENNAESEPDPVKKQKVREAANRLSQDMERVEDARLSLHTYTANEDEAKQAEFLKPLRDQPPPGFKMASLDQMAQDFGVNATQLKKLVQNEANPSQRIMVYERDEDILGPGSKYTIAFRGSTVEKADWDNNGRNELGFEAPHQANAARLGGFLRVGALRKGENIDSVVSATGHSKGGSEAQAFAAGSRCSARVFNPAGFDPQQYAATKGIASEELRIDRTSIIDRDEDGDIVSSTPTVPHTDPLYYAQYQGFTRHVMKKPVTNAPPREVEPIDSNLSVLSNEQSDTEAHSMLQVIEALERDKKEDQQTLLGARYV